MRTALLALLLASPAGAVEWWHDVGRGCGESASWNLSKRIADLPGCDGELPKGSPPGEVAMHDAKLKLHHAERLLDANTAAGVEALLAEAEAIMSKAPSDPRVAWALQRFAQAQTILKGRLAALPKEAPAPAPAPAPAAHGKK
ncbi:MAG: hypothetical protein HY059_13730 [Proteobacteria bacterium]|nr:hypothetical protein [Pseudomonadota bacterium]